MKNLLLLSLSLFYSLHGGFSHANIPACNCPKNAYSPTKVTAEFNLSDGRKVVLCGNKDTEIIKGETLYSEFVLAVCNESNIIENWGALDLCRVQAVKNSVRVETLINLPVGQNNSYRETVWTVEQIYFLNDKPVKNLSINKNIPRYTTKQINSTLKEFETAPNANTDYTDNLADKLFISAISGSKKARIDLLTFKKKFTTLDGSIAESYDKDLEMLRLWDKHHATE